MARKASASPRYVALGASDAVGVGASTPGANGTPNNGYVHRIATWLTAQYPHWTLDNLGIVGLTAPQIRDRELNLASSAQPEVVTVWAGANDVRLSVMALEPTSTLKVRFEDAFATILRTLHGETRAHVVTANLPDLSRLPAADLFTIPQRKLARDDSLAINESIARIAGLYGVPVVDLYADSRSIDPANISDDGFHPNDQGYLLMATLFESAIRAGAWRTVSGLGDVNGDGAIDLADSAALLTLISGAEVATDRQAVAGDVAPPGGNGALNVEDAVLLARRAAGLVPAGEWR